LAPASSLTLIAVTGWGQSEDRARTHAAGFDHHITKPVDMDALAALLGAAGSPRR
jgi:CheY-like chemotaxis protein